MAGPATSDLCCKLVVDALIDEHRQDDGLGANTQIPLGRAQRRKGPRPLLLNEAIRRRTLEAIEGGCPLGRLSSHGLPSENTVRDFARADQAFEAALAAALARAAAAEDARLESDLTAALAAISRGIRPTRLGAHGLMTIGRLNHLRKHMDGVDARVRAALAVAGNGPKEPIQERLEVLLAALERGQTLAEACDEARISNTDLRRRRHSDPSLDRAVRARMKIGHEFDAGAKAVVVEAIRAGHSVKEAMQLAGGFHYSTFRSQMAADPDFASLVHQAARAASGERVRPTETKAKFDQVLALIPCTNTVTEACAAVGVSISRFNSLVQSSPRHRTAYQQVMAGLDQSCRGIHRPKTSIIPRLPLVAALLRQGLCLAHACRHAGVAHVSVNRLRRSAPEIRQLILEAGHTASLTGRRMLDDPARREEVLALLRSGVPIYGLGLRGAIGETTVRAYAKERPEFAGELVDAMRQGARARSLNNTTRLDAALEAIASGVLEANLKALGLPSAGAVRYYRARDQAFAARYEAAKRMANGEVNYAKPLTPEELVAQVVKRLPPNLTKADRITCTNQAWLDALTGQLNPSNLRNMARRYAADVRPIGKGATYLNANGDVANAFRERALG